MTAKEHGGNDPFIGQVLDGKYRIDTLLGQGGMGAVYRATHILMDHLCAVKVLHSSMMSDPSAIPRFQREARAAARIRHQNAIAVNDFGITPENVVYLVMEFFPGRSLRELLKTNGRFSVERTARIVERVAAALDAAHQQGIIHRDVKPDNVMIRDLPNGEDEVKVLDFGIAKIVDSSQAMAESLTITGTIIGTPHYLSPEQCRAATDLDARSDMYSLAVVTYEMLTGSVPFIAATPIAVAMMHISDPPPSIVDKVPELPQEAEAAIHKAMAKKRDERQDSVIEFAQEFYEAVFGAPPAREPGTGPIAPYRPFPSGQTRLQRPLDGQDTGELTRIDPAQTTGQTGRATPSGGIKAITGAGHPAVNTPPPELSISSNTIMAGSFGTNTPQTQMVSADVLSGLEKKPKGAHSGLLIALGAVLVLGVVLGAVYLAGFFGAATPKPPIANTNAAPPTNPAGPPPGMVLIPGGSFKMGRDSEDPYEGPPHDVVVKPFYLDEKEVTNKQYAEFVQATGYKAPTNWTNGSYQVGTGDLPVVFVDWADARAYADWAKKRLPTEEEWEFAARGTEDRLYPWGNDWVSGNAYTKESKLTTLQPVGSVPSGASPFGIYDMAGNVWEWCNDNFKPYPGSKGETRDATYKIIRGGSLGDEKSKATTTYRNWVPPEQKYDALGFRCARSVE